VEKIKLADDFYSLAPKYRTKVRLQDMVEQELDKAREEGIAIGLNASKTEIENLIKRLILEQVSKLTTK